MNDFDNLTVDDRVEIIEGSDSRALMGERRFLGALAQHTLGRNTFKRGIVVAIYAHPFNLKELVYEVLIDGREKPTGFKRARLRKLNVLERIAEEVAAGEKEDEERAKTTPTP